MCLSPNQGAWLLGELRYPSDLMREPCHIVRFVGRWSMIDIFMESLLGALVAFGSVITIQPGMGALAFCAVVILTMFAAETFDPRLMWDAADEAGTRIGSSSPTNRLGQPRSYPS